MTTISSTKVAESRATFNRIDAVFEAHGPTMTDIIRERLRPYLNEGEADPAVRRFMELLRKQLRDSHGEVVGSDQVRIGETLQRKEAVAAAKKAAKALRGRMGFVRTTMKQSFGEEALEALPYDSRKAKKYDSLIDQGQYMVKGLDAFKSSAKAKAKTKMTDSMLAVAPPPEVLAENLQEKIDAMVEANAALSLVRTVDKAAQGGKREVLKEFERDATDIRGVLKYLLRYAGMDEHVDRLYEPRRSRSANDPPTIEIEAFSADPNDSTVAGDPPTSEHVA